MKELKFDYSKYNFRVDDNYELILEPGINEDVVRKISEIKKEPEWMTKLRLKALEYFFRRKIPEWGPDLSEIDFDKITYYANPAGKSFRRWEDVPEKIKMTFEKLGVPEAERKFLAGVTNQFESEVVYKSLRKDLEEQGVIFMDTDTALKEHEELFKKYFATVVPLNDNKFASLNSAVWSGGSFIYVPENVKVKIPLQAYFRINARNMGQFERTLIIAEKNSEVTYIEGCSAPIYSDFSLHSAVVEIIAKENAKVNYITIQNWSNDVYNLVTKRAFAYRNAQVTWIDGNIGSKVTMKYPSVYLLGENAKGEVISLAYAGKGQNQDAGAKMLHFARNTSSRITSKSVSLDGGITTYRGFVKVFKGAENSRINVNCDALILDEESKSNTFPIMDIEEKNVAITHEAKVGKIGEDKIFYLRSRGIPEEEAMSMIIFGFMKEFIKELPLEYAVELNRLIKLEMEGSVG